MKTFEHPMDVTKRFMDRTSLFLTFFFAAKLFAQTAVYKTTHVYVQGNLGYETGNDDGQPQAQDKPFLSFSAGVGIPAVQTIHFSQEWHFGYRYFSRYADNIIFPGNGLIPDTLDYHGLWISPSFFVGRKHQWELAFPTGGGLLERNNRLIGMGAMEMTVRSGYRLITPSGLMLRMGGALHFGKNGFDRVLYSGYFSAGFAFQKQVKTEDAGQNRHGGYAVVSLNPYAGSITGDLIGTNLQVDHFFLHRGRVKLGYSAAVRYGVPWSEDPQFACSAALMVLTGNSPHRFEMSLGPNVPFGDNGLPGAEWFQLIHYGMGYRYSADNSRFMLRLGSATTQILYFGVGVRLGEIED